MDDLIAILERHGARRVEQPTLRSMCPVYSIDPARTQAYLLWEEVERSSYFCSDCAAEEVFQRYADGTASAVHTGLLRGRTADGEIDHSPDADGQVIEALLAGGSVVYGSLEERDRVHARLEPGVLVFTPDLEYLSARAYEQRCVQAGEAVFLTTPDSRAYHLLVRKQTGEPAVPHGGDLVSSN